MHKLSIGFVEDDDIIRENYSQLLEEAGYVVSAFATKADALVAFAKVLPDMLLLDLQLGNDSEAGFDICRAVRLKSGTVPVVFLTGRDDEVDKASGMRLGADDYITKDASFHYILIRIDALFRRHSAILGAVSKHAQTSESDSELNLDQHRSMVTWKGKPVELSLTYFWIVEDLVSHSGNVRSHRDLMQAARVHVASNTVVAYVKAIRQRFKSVDPTFSQIHTERGKGYRWVD